MTQAHERTATLSALVAEEVRALLARRRMSGRQLATLLSVSPSWVSYRLTGVQAIDLNDLNRIANALGVGVHELLPSPDVAATARTMASYVAPSSRLSELVSRPRDNRPSGHAGASSGAGPRRTTYLSRGERRKRD